MMMLHLPTLFACPWWWRRLAGTWPNHYAGGSRPGHDQAHRDPCDPEANG
jgi:hypothetical protein